MECYCVARNKPIRREITKPQTAQQSLVSGFEVSSRVLNFIVIGQYTINIPKTFSGVHGFQSLTVTVFKIFQSVGAPHSNRFSESI